MNREIKFRAFDGEIMLFYEPQTDEEYDSEWVEHFFSKCHVMQFTGLYDKNETGIFEGDILQSETDKPMVVGWSKKFASFVLKKSGWAFSHWFGECCNPENCEVIGNIHENPELLKH